MNERLTSALIVLPLILSSGCVSVEEVVPPIDQLLMNSSSERGVPTTVERAALSAALSQGRQLYLQHCTACHAPVRITAFSHAEWEEVFPRMVRKSALTPLDEAAIRKYVAQVRCE